LIAVANEETVHLVYPGLSTNEVNLNTKTVIDQAASTYKVESAANKESHCSWDF